MTVILAGPPCTTLPNRLPGQPGQMPEQALMTDFRHDKDENEPTTSASGGNPTRESLQEATRRVLTDRRWSLRKAEEATGVNNATIKNMSDGKKVGPEHVLKFAAMAGENVIEWADIIDFPLRQLFDTYLRTVRDPAAPRTVIRPGEQVELLRTTDGEKSEYAIDEAAAAAIFGVLEALGKRVTRD